MNQNMNQIPPGKVCPEVGGKKVVDVLQATIDDKERIFKVLLQGGGTATVKESELLDEPKKEEGN